MECNDLKRGQGYFVLLFKEVEKYLTEEERYHLFQLVSKIETQRILQEKRTRLISVVVESDWPIYEKVCKMIEEME